MALQGMWVPGNVVIPAFVGTRLFGDTSIYGLVKARFDQSVFPVAGTREGSDIDWSDIVGSRGPGGAAFRGQGVKAMVFTFPIPSPVFRSPGTAPPPDPNRARVNKAFVLFDSQPGAQLNNVWVFDGGRRIFGQMLLGVGGSLGDRIDFRAEDPSRSNAWELGDVEVFFGVSISVFVQFSPDENNNQIIFRAAGADFLV